MVKRLRQRMRVKECWHWHCSDAAAPGPVWMSPYKQGNGTKNLIQSKGLRLLISGRTIHLLMCKSVCIHSGSIDIFTALLYIWLLLMYGSFFPLTLCSQALFLLPTVNIGNCLICLTLVCDVTILWWENTDCFSPPRPQIFRPLSSSLKKNTWLIWGGCGMMNEVSYSFDFVLKT